MERRAEPIFFHREISRGNKDDEIRSGSEETLYLRDEIEMTDFSLKLRFYCALPAVMKVDSGGVRLQARVTFSSGAEAGEQVAVVTS